MGVQRIPVGGVQPDKYQSGRDWFDPFRPYFCFEPIGVTKGRRTAVCTGVQYKAFDRALYLNTTGNANKVFEIGSGQIIPIPPPGTSSAGIWDYPFKFYMTFNRSSGAIVNAAGECCQGFGIGNMGLDTPWEGQPSVVCPYVIHVRYNITRQRWELFTASLSDNGFSTPLTIQPITDVDLKIPEFCMEWLPPRTIKVYCNEILIHTQRIVFPNDLEPQGISDIDQLMFVTNGSNVAFTHVEAGFYCPRFYQHIEYQTIS